MLFRVNIFLVILYSLHIAVDATDGSWWRHMQIYQILLSSFKDSDGDGIGDLNGLTSKIDHFVDLGIDVIYLTPMFPSPMIDNGYDVANYTDINPMFGSLDDFDKLMSEAKARGIKVMIDMVINHSSDKHTWFIKSINKEDPYTDYYVWKDPKGYDKKGNPIPPNNWISIFEGSTWEWNEKRQQFYLHQAAVQQPDLNFRNKKVIDEIKKVFKFWLDRGVAGFRLDAVQRLIEDEQFRDEPPLLGIKDPKKFMDFNHIYTIDQPETYEIIKDLRKFVHRVTKKFGDYERVLIGELYSDYEPFRKYYRLNGERVLHFPLNIDLNAIKKYQDAKFYHQLITNSINVVPKGEAMNWNTENHDRYRKGLWFNEEYEFMYVTMVMLLPGVAYHYYGQEIGMTGCEIRDDQHIDTHKDTYTKKLRDAARTPMQWDNSLNAGFSNNHQTYLPVCSNYWRINVDKQKHEENSRYNMFKKMSHLRKRETLRHGDVNLFAVSAWVFAFTRTLEDHETFLMVTNLGTEMEIIDLHISIKGLPEHLKVEIASPNSGYKPGDKVSAHPDIKNVFTLRPASTVVFSG